MGPKELDRSVRLEIAVQDVEGASTAVRHGADRMEVCQALAVGGLTPSLALVEHSVGRSAEQSAAAGVGVRPLIRPRAGGYRCTPAERAVMRRDVEVLGAAGAEGFVVGVLSEGVPRGDGPGGGGGAGDSGGMPVLDAETFGELVEAADGRPVIAHRCVDVLLGAGADPARLVEQLLALGVSGMLTSGGAGRAVDGCETLAKLVRAADGRVEIVAGGGVRPEHIAALVDVGVDAVHLSASGSAAAGPSGPGGGEDVFVATDPALVQAAREALDAATRSRGRPRVRRE